MLDWLMFFGTYKSRCCQWLYRAVTDASYRFTDYCKIDVIWHKLYTDPDEGFRHDFGQHHKVHYAHKVIFHLARFARKETERQTSFLYKLHNSLEWEFASRIASGACGFSSFVACCSVCLGMTDAAKYGMHKNAQSLRGYQLICVLSF